MDNLNAFMHELCDAAAVETLKNFRQPLEIANKEAAAFDPVTIADKAAECAIRDLIGSKYPEHGILGEEYDETNPGASYRWVIDPIDGTRSYISGLPIWGTLIGLYQNGEPLAGIMHQPFTQERYFSDGKSTVYTRGNERRDLITSKITKLEDSTLLTTSPNIFAAAEVDAYNRVEGAVQLARYGLDCYGYAMVAAGNVELVVESGLHIYDIAALIPIVENAGGMVSDWQGNSAANGGQILAAANADIHAQAMELLNQ